MGPDTSSSKATNIINSATSIMTSVGHSVAQVSQVSVDTSQEIFIINTGGTVEAEFLGDQTVELKVDTMQDAYFASEFDTEIENSIDQVAEAITETSMMGSGTSESTNITNLVTQLGYEINTSYFQSCSVNVNMTQSARIINTGGSTKVTFGGDEVVNSIAECTNITSNVISIKNRITNEVSQSATAAVESSIWTLILFIAMLIVVCGLIIFITMTQILKLFLFAAIFVAFFVGLYFLITWIKGTGPFYEEEPELPPEEARASEPKSEVDFEDCASWPQHDPTDPDRWKEGLNRQCCPPGTTECTLNEDQCECVDLSVASWAVLLPWKGYIDIWSLNLFKEENATVYDGLQIHLRIPAYAYELPKSRLILTLGVSREEGSGYQSLYRRVIPLWTDTDRFITFPPFEAQRDQSYILRAQNNGYGADEKTGDFIIVGAGLNVTSKTTLSPGMPLMLVTDFGVTGVASSDFTYNTTDHIFFYKGAEYHNTYGQKRVQLTVQGSGANGTLQIEYLDDIGEPMIDPANQAYQETFPTAAAYTIHVNFPDMDSEQYSRAQYVCAKCEDDSFCDFDDPHPDGLAGVRSVRRQKRQTTVSSESEECIAAQNIFLKILRGFSIRIINMDDSVSFDISDLSIV